MQVEVDGWSTVVAEIEALLFLEFLTKGYVIIEHIDGDPY